LLTSAPLECVHGTAQATPEALSYSDEAFSCGKSNKAELFNPEMLENLVWWDGMERVMRYYSKMFHVFVTKQVSGFAGSNHKLARWNDDVQDVCRNCGLSGESTKHMTRCRDEGRVQRFPLSVEDVLVSLQDAGIDIKLVDLFEDYLLAQGSRSMVE